MSRLPTTTPLDLADLAGIEDLALLSRTVVASLGPGMHRSAHTGTSAEFEQYRPYAQGDDTRFVDWKLYGRSDRLHVKQFSEETSLRTTILLDCSGSMNYGSGPITKFQYARMLAASLIRLSNAQRDAVGFAAYHHDLLAYLPPRRSPGWTHRLLVKLARQTPQGDTDTTATLRFVGDALPGSGMIVLISDLLHPIETALQHLRLLRGHRHDVLVLQISDVAECTFAFDRAVVLTDLESGSERYAVPEAVREGYLENRRRHFDAIRQACLRSEIDFAEFVTRDPLQDALRRYLLHRRNAILTRSRRRTRA